MMKKLKQLTALMFCLVSIEATAQDSTTFFNRIVQDSAKTNFEGGMNLAPFLHAATGAVPLEPAISIYLRSYRPKSRGYIRAGFHHLLEHNYDHNIIEIKSTSDTTFRITSLEPNNNMYKVSAGYEKLLGKGRLQWNIGAEVFFAGGKRFVIEEDISLLNSAVSDSFTTRFQSSLPYYLPHDERAVRQLGIEPLVGLSYFINPRFTLTANMHFRWYHEWGDEDIPYPGRLINSNNFDFDLLFSEIGLFYRF